MMYVDPDGEFFWLIPVAIGAVLGGYSGYKIGEANGASGWDMFGYVFGGAVIGGAAGGAGLGVGALGGSSMLAGATAGALAGAGFNGLATGWDVAQMAKGAGIGFISGLVGGGFASAIGGGLGAFAGGAAGSGLSTALYGGSGSDIFKSALLGGTLAYGTYEFTSYINWKYGGGNKFGNVDLTYKAFKTIQADFQRSRFYRKEYGGVIANDGTVIRAPAKYRHRFHIDMHPDWMGEANNHGGFKAMYHTHWAKAGVNHIINGELGKTPYGPSKADNSYIIQTKSAGYNFNGLIIDQTSSHMYNGVRSVDLGFGSFMRSFPWYDLSPVLK